MSVRARLIGSIALPPLAEEHVVSRQSRPDRALVLARSDKRLVAYDVDRVLSGDLTPAEFPAPWPRHAGTCTVSPGLGFVVYAGVHAVQAFDASGGLRWEVRHACWEGSCLRQHSSYQEFAGLSDHRYPESGSVRVSGDEKLVWAHVRGPLPGDELPEDRDPWAGDELWLVLDAVDGRVLARMPTESVAGGSHHLPHPDPARMALNVGEGQDGSTTWLGRLHEGRLDGLLVSQEAILVGVAASGRTLVTIDHGSRDELSLRRYEDGSVMTTLAAAWVSQREEREKLRWTLAEIGSVDEHTVVLETSIYGHGEQRLEHWLIDLDAQEVRGPVVYPEATPGSPMGCGRGRWLTPRGGLRYDLWAEV